ncbi:hypothetical protein V8G54_001015 [Vigna mungo]|uniref:Uncharacterized protein n=1 Tax=Vigna mungo TaxID=3915 RepID=A0AAQ3SB30_VIGMU
MLQRKKNKTMCYVGKATKIFIFIVTVLIVMGLVLGLGILRRRHHTTANECFDGSCSRLPPPAISIPNFNSPTPLPIFNTSYPTNHSDYKSKHSSSFRHQPIFVVAVNAAIARPNGASGEFPSFLRHHTTSVSPLTSSLSKLRRNFLSFWV